MPAQTTSPRQPPASISRNPSSSSFVDRMMDLAMTLQFAWFIGHVATMFFSLRYVMYFVSFVGGSFWGQTYYRLALIAILLPYSIVIFKSARTKIRAKQPISALDILVNENGEYFFISGVLLLHPTRYLPTLLPYNVYAGLHILNYLRQQLIPAITGTKHSPGQQDSLGIWVKENYSNGMLLVAWLELFSWLRLFFSALSFSWSSIIVFVLYSVFCRLRYSQSQYFKAVITRLNHRGNVYFSTRSTNPTLAGYWQNFQSVMASARDRTSMEKYLGTGESQIAGSKKAS